MTLGPKDAASLETFRMEWEARSAPKITEYCREAKRSAESPQALLCQLVATDLRFRWSDEFGKEETIVEDPDALPHRPLLEDYAARIPELGALSELPIDLIVEEFRVRQRAEGRPDTASYHERFPAQKAELTDALSAVSSDVITDLDVPMAAGGSSDSVTLPPTADPDLDAATIAPSDASSDGLGATDALMGTRDNFGDYEILEEIARGGMGVVYRARQRRANRIVAIKMILSGQLASDDEVKRFYTEAEAAANLDHPGIVPIFDVGELNGQHYFSMGYVDGPSLKDKISAGPMKANEAAVMLRRIAEAVAYAHEKGIIHRDLKPANVLLDQSDRPRVTDFGLAKQLHTDSNLTATGQVMGTPSYMPPEQAGGRIDVGPLADVYSLGAILYELLTGRPPFQASSSLDTLMQVMNDEPVPPSRLISSVPKDLETICLKCLAKEEKRRIASTVELVDELERFERGEAILSRPVGPIERAWRWCKRKPLVSSLIGTIAALVLGVSIAGPIIAVQQSNLREEAVESANIARDAKRDAETARGLTEEALKKTVAAQKTAEAKRAEAEELAGRLSEEKQRAVNSLYATSISLAYREWLDNNVGRAQQLLSEAPRELRHWEWHYLMSLCRTEEFNLRGHTAQVIDVRFSPDSRQMATLGRDNRVVLWDVRTGIRIRALELKGHHFVLGPSGQRVVEADNQHIRVRDLRTGAVEFRSRADRRINRICLDNDGQRVAYAMLSETEPSPATVIHIRTLKGDADDVVIKGLGGTSTPSISFSPDGRFLATTGNVENVAAVWDTANGELVNRFIGHVLPLSDVAIDASGKRLATSGYDGMARVWDIETAEMLHVLRGHRDIVFGIQFSADGEWLATAGKDRSIKLWDAVTGMELMTVRGNTAAVMDVAFSPDATRLGSAGDDLTARIWNVERHLTAEESIPKRLFEQFARMAKIPTDQTETLLQSVLEMVYDHVSQEWQSEYGHAGPVVSVAFAQGSEIFISAGHAEESTSVRAVRAETGEELWIKTAPRGAEDVAVTTDGTLVAAALNLAGDDAVKVWEVESGRETVSLPSPGERAYRVAFSPDGSSLAVGSQANRNGVNIEVDVWNLATKQRLHRFTHSTLIYDLEFTSDGKELITASPHGVRFYDLESGTLRNTIDARTHAMTVHPSKPLLASSHPDGRIRLWDIPTGERRGEITGPQQRLLSIAFSADGKRLVTGSDSGTTSIWDPESLQRLLTLRGHTHQVHSVTFSRDGRRFGSAGYDGVVNLWDRGSLSEEESDDAKWQVVFTDDFERDTPGENWITQSGEWTIADGKLQGTLDVSTTNQRMTAASIRLDQPLPESIEVRFDVVSDLPTGFQFGLTGKRDGLVAELLGVENPFLLTRDAVLWASQGPNNYVPVTRNSRQSFESKKTYAIRLRRESNKIAVYVDDAETFSTNLQTAPTPTLFLQGIYGVKGATFSVDNLEVLAPHAAIVTRKARDIAEALHEEVLLPELVAERLKQDASLDREIRDQALVIAETLSAPLAETLAKRATYLLESSSKTEDLSLGLRYARMAVQQDAADPSYATTLGGLLLRTDELDEAVAVLTDASERQRELRGIVSPRCLAYLALSNVALGNANDAFHQAQQLQDFSFVAAWRREPHNATLLEELIQALPNGDSSDEETTKRKVRDLVVETQLAARSFADVEAALNAWDADGTFVYSRTADPNSTGVTVQGPALREYFRLQWLGTPIVGDTRWPDQLEVHLNGDEATVNVVQVSQVSANYSIRPTTYVLRRTNGPWKIHRGHMHITGGRSNGAQYVHNDQTWKERDESAEKLLSSGQTAQLANLLRGGFRGAEALELLKPLTENQPNSGQLWQIRAATNSSLGNVDDWIFCQKKLLRLIHPNFRMQRLGLILNVLAATERMDDLGDVLAGLPAESHEHWYTRAFCARLALTQARASGSKVDENITPFGQLQHGLDEGMLDKTAHTALAEWVDDEVDWWVLGPFESGENFKGFDQVFPPESTPDRMSPIEHDGHTLPWTPVRVERGGFLRMLESVVLRDYVTAYAFAELVCDEPRDGVMRFGSDDGAIVWLNGKKVHAARVNRAHVFGIDRVPVTLKKGKNSLLVKVDQATGDWGFSIDFVDNETQLPIQLDGRNVADGDPK